MPDGRHLISVILPTYNREQYIRPAIESVLSQPYRPMEIVVVDDGSTDATPDVVGAIPVGSDASIRYVRQANRGESTARNHGLRLAQGSVIGFIDSDDLWAPGRLPWQLECLSEPTASGEMPGVILGRKEYFADEGTTINPAELAAANDRPFHYNLGCSLFMRWVFDRVGVFDERYPMVNDWDWFIRVKEAGIPVSIFPQVTLLGRIHGRNITRERDLCGQSAVKMLREHLVRLRRPAP